MSREVVTAVKPWPAVIKAPTQRQLLKAVHKAKRRGEVVATGPIQRGAGMYGCRVLRVKHPAPPPPVWRKPLLITCAVVGVMAGLGLLVRWVVASMAATLAGVTVGGVLGALAVMWIVVTLIRGLAGGGREFSGTFRGRMR